MRKSKLSHALLLSTIFLCLTPTIASACKRAPPEPPPAPRANESAAQYQTRLETLAAQTRANEAAARQRQQLADQASSWPQADKILVAEITSTGRVNAIPTNPDVGTVAFYSLMPRTWVKGRGAATPFRFQNMMTSCGEMGIMDAAVGERVIFFSRGGPVSQSSIIMSVRQNDAHDPRLASLLAPKPPRRVR
jgi:hypothetical protein